MDIYRRDELEKAWDLIDEAVSIIDSCKDDEEDAFYDLPDSLQQSEQGEQMQEFISLMESSSSNLCSAVDSIKEIIFA